MAETTYTFSAATLSWISPESAKKYLLPEWDHDGEPPSTVTFGDVTEPRYCRFSHLLACWIVVDGGKIVRLGAYSRSGMHEGTSFLRTNPQVYEMRRDFQDWTSERAVFVQTVGCRTQAPEIIGGRTGEEAVRLATAVAVGPLEPVVSPFVAPYGRQIGKEAAEATLVFPPIWTKIAITMHANAACTAEVREHSLFPSLTYYESRFVPANVPTEALVWNKRGTSYDGGPEFEHWLLGGGWGQGNPWLVDHP